MVKRIPCRIVRTEPLSKSGNALHHASRSNHFHHKIGYVNPKYKPTNDTIIYTRKPEITNISKDNSLAGEILDCYV